MPIPLQIYLDNSDYSELSNPIILEKSPQKEAVLSYLIHKLDEGVIEIRYSAYIMAESMHESDSARNYAIQRANLITAISRGKCFKPISEAYMAEAIAYYRAFLGLEIPPTDILSDTNDWLGLQTDSTFMPELRQDIERKVQEVISETTWNRAQRKQLEKQLFYKGKLTAQSAVKILNDKEALRLPTRFGHISLDDFMDKRTLIDWLTGKICDAVAAEELSNRMLNVAFVFDKMTAYDDKMRASFRTLIRGEEARILNLMNTMLENILDKAEEFKKLGYCVSDVENKFLKKMPEVIRKAVLDARRRVLNDLFEKQKQAVSSVGILNLLHWQETIGTSPLGSIPSIDTVLQLWQDMLIKRLKDASYKNNPSDAGDVLHASYAHYCDIMRVDKRTHVFLEALKKMNPKIQTHFVKKIEELPEAIERVLGLKEVDRSSSQTPVSV